ncbi:MAG: response regulator transcription factor, partial [Christensenellaceae bacterium]|nr:response regulator transcription factor [Christensenellaceae bacterium]
LDILLPELNGLEVLRRIRKTSNLPIILLTARDAIPDKVTGLDMGADDYITKPFSIEELLARIRSTLRNTAKSNILSCGKLQMDVSRHLLTYDNNKINLTATEFELLKNLLENKSIVLSRETLLNKVWGYEYTGDTNVVDVYIRYLRSKIDNVFNIKLINTVRGVGYCINEEQE